MKPRVFLDTNLFIYAFEFQKSNSRKILDLLNQGAIEAVISERVLSEVQAYFRKYYSKDLAGLFRNYLLASCVVIPSPQVKSEMDAYKGEIKDKDLEQLAVVKQLGLKFLISYDRDFEPFSEYKTPRQFLKDLGLKSEKTDF